MKGGEGLRLFIRVFFLGVFVTFPPPPAHSHTTTSDVYGSYVFHGAAATGYLFAPSSQLQLYMSVVLFSRHEFSENRGARGPLQLSDSFLSL